MISSKKLFSGVVLSYRNRGIARQDGEKPLINVDKHGGDNKLLISINYGTICQRWPATSGPGVVPDKMGILQN
jgi:hypothetical protein